MEHNAAAKPPSPAPSVEKYGIQEISTLLPEEKSTFGASAVGSFYTTPRPDDPYCYQTGFGNRFSSEAMLVQFCHHDQNNILTIHLPLRPGSLPTGGQNVPQRCPFDLYSEQVSDIRPET